MKNPVICADFYGGIGYPNGFNKLHSHKFDEISVMRSGDITYISDSVRERVSGKSIIYSKAYQLHNPYVSPENSYERYQVCFFADNLTDILPSLRATGVSSFIAPLNDADYDELEGYMRLLLIQHTKPNEAMRNSLLLSALYLKISEIFTSATHVPIKVTDTYINEVMEYIEKNYASKLKIEDIAAEFFVSRTKLINDFRLSLGMTVFAFLSLTRLKNAKRLLESGVSVTHTAEMCGYSSSGHFINSFVAHGNITPLKYQQMAKKAND